MSCLSNLRNGGDIMRDFLKFINGHRRIVCAIVLLLLIITIGIPIVINWMYKQPALTTFFSAEWEAADALSYYGSVLTFLGTVTLSALALWQNHQIKVGNDEHIALLAQMEKAKDALHFRIQVVALLDNANKAKIVLSNLTENIAYNIFISKLQIINKVNRKVCWECPQKKTYDHLGAFKEWEIELNNPKIPDAQHYITFIISYNNKYGKSYTLRATGLWDDVKQELHFEIAEEGTQTVN